MTRPPVKVVDERRHQLDSDRWSGEAWSFDLVAHDVAAFVRVALYPSQRRAWFWAAVMGDDLPYVLCRDPSLALPASTGVIELRGEGLWMHAICETPLEHWTVAMEAFAVAFEDPTAAWGDERGDRIGLAFDLEWESAANGARWKDGDEGIARYDLACDVHGDLQVGERTWTIDATGSRHHEWGRLDWSGPGLEGSRDRPPGVVREALLLVDRPDGAARLRRVLSDDGSARRWLDSIE